jgi:pimeloyl-ACP methyl ester carboxylesterase
MRSPILLSICIVFVNCSYNSFYYFPDKHTVPIKHPSTDIILTNKTGRKIHCLQFNALSNKDYIFFLHGNAGNVSQWSSLLTPLINEGYNIFMPDYQGYGESSGIPTHLNVFHDANLAFSYFMSNTVKTNKCIVFGQSLGGHLSICVTEKHKEGVKLLIVEGAFSSFKDIALEKSPDIANGIIALTLYSPYNALTSIKNIACPVHILHSKTDSVVPYWMGQKLYSNAVHPKYFHEITGGHLDGLRIHPDIILPLFDM